jgi:hypothetical protein
MIVNGIVDPPSPPRAGISSVPAAIDPGLIVIPAIVSGCA